MLSACEKPWWREMSYMRLLTLFAFPFSVVWFLKEARILSASQTLGGGKSNKLICCQLVQPYLFLSVIVLCLCYALSYTV